MRAQRCLVKEIFCENSIDCERADGGRLQCLTGIDAHGCPPCAGKSGKWRSKAPEARTSALELKAFSDW